MTDQRLYTEQEQEIAEALQRMDNKMGTKEDLAMLRCALGLQAKPRPIPNINATEKPF